jgi:peptidoglycan/xylan/chitin deacetylase (PgdA/CDA1 family)
MDYLSDSHYQTIGLGDLADYWFSGKPLPVKPIILTFDDGYDDNYTYAYAILRRHEFMGTFFVLTDAVGNAGYLTWEQIVVMDRHGMDIESHGRTHDDLAASSKEWATWQIAGSRNILEAKLGHQIRFYCYPSGRYTAETIAILKANGYVSAVSTAYGATHDKASLFNLTRVRVSGSDSLQEFIVKVTTAP